MMFSEQELRLQSISVVLIGLDRERRRALAEAFGPLSVRIKAELGRYPDRAQVTALTDGDCDAIVIDLDGDAQAALSLVEELCSRNSALTAMVYSRKEDPELLLQCMQAGAREFIQEPISQQAITGAVVRTAARRETPDRRRLGAKTLLFWSVKGGAGASTLAANFASALAHESGAPVALVDLDFELGDLSVLLNLSPPFSVVDALQSPDRLDWDFLSGLMVKHASGVHLLAAPDRYEGRDFRSEPAAILKVLRLLQEQFAYVVVDTGGNRSLPPELLGDAEAIYLVAQVDVPSLRNAQRLASHLRDGVERNDRIHIVLNRFDARRSDIPADQIERALTFPVAWRIPNDYAAVRNAANTGLTLAPTTSSVGRCVREMARAACGKQEQALKKKGWNLFR